MVAEVVVVAPEQETPVVQEIRGRQQTQHLLTVFPLLAVLLIRFQSLLVVR